MESYLIAIDDGLRMRDSGIWAAEKLDYLHRYIDVFETSMREKWPERNYVDLKQFHFETKSSGSKAASRSTILQTVIDKPEGGKNDTA